MKLRELLSGPSAWTQGGNARAADGETVHAFSDRAVCWCLVGAIRKVCWYPSGFDLVKAHRIETRIIKALGLADFSDVMKWNDAPERKFEEVKSLVEKLDI